MLTFCQARRIVPVDAIDRRIRRLGCGHVPGGREVRHNAIDFIRLKRILRIGSERRARAGRLDLRLLCLDSYRGPVTRLKRYVLEHDVMERPLLNDDGLHLLYCSGETERALQQVAVRKQWSFTEMACEMASIRGRALRTDIHVGGGGGYFDQGFGRLILSWIRSQSGKNDIVPVRRLSGLPIQGPRSLRVRLWW